MEKNKYGQKYNTWENKDTEQVGTITQNTEQSLTKLSFSFKIASGSKCSC